MYFERSWFIQYIILFFKKKPQTKHLPPTPHKKNSIKGMAWRYEINPRHSSHLVSTRTFYTNEAEWLQIFLERVFTSKWRVVFHIGWIQWVNLLGSYNENTHLFFDLTLSSDSSGDSAHEHLTMTRSSTLSVDKVLVGLDTDSI